MVRYRLASLVLFALAPATALAGGLVRADAPATVVVRFDPGTSAAERTQAFASVDADDHDALTGVPRVHSIALPEGASVGTALRSLRANPDVAWASRDVRTHTARTPNDPLFGALWGLPAMGAPTAWDTITGSSTVPVGVVDTGLAATHPDLAANVRADLSRNFVAQGGTTDPADWADDNGHGTHVAGTIGAVGNNGVGVTGVSWAAGLAAARVFDMSGSGFGATMAEGLGWAGSHTRVVNVSATGPLSSAEDAAVAAHPDTLYVAAAGNDGADNDVDPVSPCVSDQPNVICVAAVDANNQMAAFSNYGARTVDLGAPGVDIESTFIPITEFADVSSTSAFGSWTQTPGSTWQVGTTIEGVAYAATNGNLTPDGQGVLTTLTMPVGMGALAGTACRLSYFLALRMNDGLTSYVVQAKSPSGAWTTVDGPWTGDTGGLFESGLADLSGYDGESGVLLRFQVSGPAGPFSRTAPGRLLEVANLSVRCVTPQPAAGTYSSAQGTSMAAPHVAGAAALLLSARPELTVAQLRNALLSTVTPTPSLSGRTVTGGRLNLAAALAAVTAVAPAPATPAAPEATPAPTTPMALTLRGTQPVKLRTSSWRVKVPLQCVGTAAPNCVMTVQLKVGTRVIGSLKVGIPSGWRGTKTVVVNAVGKSLLNARSPLDGTVRTAPRDGTTGLVKVGRVRITRG